MTMSIIFTATKVTPTSATFTAVAGEQFTSCDPKTGEPWTIGDGNPLVLPGIYSSTEGKVARAILTLEFESEDHPTINVGDLLSGMSTHFGPEGLRKRGPVPEP